MPKEGREPRRVLDIGAGAGVFLKAAQAEGIEAIGLEPSQWLVDWGIKNLGVKLISGTSRDLADKLIENGGKKFDWITLWDVLEHTESPSEELKIVNHALETDGYLTISYPDISSRLARAFGRKWWFILSVHLFYFTPVTIKRYLEDSGFEVIFSGRHFQKLNLGYLTFRAEKYLKRFSKIVGSILRFLHLYDVSVPYYASQRVAIARKIREI